MIDLALSETWMTAGLCAQTDPELFFPTKGGTSEPAKRICSRCPVAAECLEFALTHDLTWGVWGGTSERQRRKLRHAEDAA